MPKNGVYLQKHTMQFRQGDIEKIREIYPEVAYSVVIRKLVSALVDSFKDGESTLKLKLDID